MPPPPVQPPTATGVAECVAGHAGNFLVECAKGLFQGVVGMATRSLAGATDPSGQPPPLLQLLGPPMQD
eukprot:8009702-Alexandrium_andersonii.AAC.1